MTRKELHAKIATLGKQNLQLREALAALVLATEINDSDGGVFINDPAIEDAQLALAANPVTPAEISTHARLAKPKFKKAAVAK